LAAWCLVEVGEGERGFASREPMARTPSLRLASLLRRQAKPILSRKGREEILQ
jgi:hypothetical protein